MKKNGKIKKIALKTETVRALEASQLARAGGAAKPSDGLVCETISHGLSCGGVCSTNLWC